MKKKISIKVEERILEELDKFCNSLGISRTSYFLNAARIYKLFLNKELLDNSQDAINEQLNRIVMLLNSLQTEENVLRKRAAEIIKDVSTQNAPNLVSFKNEIVDLLKQFNKINTPTIARFLNLEEGITFKILTVLKRDEIIDINHKFEWYLK